MAKKDKFITLPANAARVMADRAAFREIMERPLEQRAAQRKEIADASSANGAGAGDGDFTRVSLAEGKFIDLAIHKDTFCDDIGIRTDVLAETPIAWKTRYSPVVGVTTGSVYGAGVRTLYQTQDNAQFLTPFLIDTQEVMVPTMALTQDPAKLGQRQAGLLRQAEALKLQMETFIINFLTGQPLGTALNQSVYNYATQVVSPYTDKTVYVADPGVESGTYETSNIINVQGEGGLTPSVWQALLTQELLTGRRVNTIHIPKKGLPWLKMLQYATIVANASNFSSGQASNQYLAGVPADEWTKTWKMDMTSALENGLIIEIFGRQYKIKANNALPKGCAICTTDEPALEIFNVTDRSYDYDVNDPREPYFVSHGSKRQMAVALPDPWVRNWYMLVFDTPTL